MCIFFVNLFFFHVYSHELFYRITIFISDLFYISFIHRQIIIIFSLTTNLSYASIKLDKGNQFMYNIYTYKIINNSSFIY